MEREDDMYQDALKLRSKAKSLYMQEVFDEVIEEKECELNGLRRELCEYNKSMNRLLFGKEMLNQDDVARLEGFIQTYCPQNVMKK